MRQLVAAMLSSSEQDCKAWPKFYVIFCYTFLASARIYARFAKMRVLGSSHLVMVHSTSSAERNLHEHMRGWNHLRKLESLKVAEKSVYIRGFASDLTQGTLQSFLEEHIGGVNWIWLNEDVSGMLQHWLS